MNDRIEMPHPPTCPWWCTVAERDHRTEYSSAACDNPTELHRNHLRSFGDVSLVQDEANKRGTVTLAPVAIHVYDDQPKSPAAAQRLADDLREAAEFARQITPPRAIKVGDRVVEVPACPPWCDLPADHDLDCELAREWNGVLNRVHSAGLTVIETQHAAEVSVQISQVTTVGAPYDDSPEAANVVLSTTVVSLTGKESREIGAALIAAADRLEAIEGQR